MVSEKKDETTTEGNSSESQETELRARVRDLKPEKDPMGAGLDTPAAAPE